MASAYIIRLGSYNIYIRKERRRQTKTSISAAGHWLPELNYVVTSSVRFDKDLMNRPTRNLSRRISKSRASTRGHEHNTVKYITWRYEAFPGESDFFSLHLAIYIGTQWKRFVSVFRDRNRQCQRTLLGAKFCHKLTLCYLGKPPWN